MFPFHCFLLVLLSRVSIKRQNYLCVFQRCSLFQAEGSCQHRGGRWARALRIHVREDLSPSTLWEACICCMYCQTVRLFWGVGEFFCLLILMSLYGCIADSEKHQEWLFYSQFLNWILKNVGVYWKVLHSSGVLALAIQNACTAFLSSVIISIFIRQNPQPFLVKEVMFL